MNDDLKPINLNAEETVTAKPVTVSKKQGKAKMKMIGWLLLLVAAGGLTGYKLSGTKGTVAGPKALSSVEDGVTAGSSYGIEDATVFSDSAEGEVASGGIDGEGSHHLIREGGESQYVYMTSSIVDLDQFVGRTVKIWGQTFDARTAGWLMDVGRLEVIK